MIAVRPPPPPLARCGVARDLGLFSVLLRGVVRGGVGSALSPSVPLWCGVVRSLGRPGCFEIVIIIIIIIIVIIIIVILLDILIVILITIVIIMIIIIFPFLGQLPQEAGLTGTPSW